MTSANAVGESRPHASARRRPHLAWILAVAYLLVIAYASLQPFSGWWTPPEEIRLFMLAPWPRYITLEDVLVNIVAYVPLGFLLARALMRKLRNPAAVLAGGVLAALISFGMEAAQMFMPSRVASNVDVLTNSIGALIGALAAPLFSPTRLLGLRLSRLRRSWFVYGRTADVGLVLMSVWLATQLNPTAQLFGTGNLRDTFDLPARLIHTPQLLFAAQAAVSAFNVLGLGLVAVALTRESKPAAASVGTLLGAAFAAKAFATIAIVRSPDPFSWLTPGIAVGVAVAASLLLVAARMSRQAQWTCASLSFAAAILAVNIAPDNPYQTLPPQLLTGPTHFLSFSAIVRSLSELWPFLAIAYAAAAAHEQRRTA